MFASRPIFVAHRGLSWSAPEETRASYTQALDAGAKFLELDVQRTKDGKIILFHDADLLRVTNAKEIFPSAQEGKHLVGSFTIEELKLLDAGSWFNKLHPERARPDYVGQQILTLDELVTIVEERTPKAGLFIEFKSPSLYPGIEEDVIKLLKERGLFEQHTKARAVLMSFDSKCIEKLSVLAPHLPRVLLVDETFTGNKHLAVDEAIRCKATVLGPIGNLFGEKVLEIPGAVIQFRKFVKRAHQNDLLVVPWVLNSQMHFWLFLKMIGTDGIITDRIDLLKGN